MITTIQTELGYLVPSAEKPIYIASEGGAEAQLDISAQFSLMSRVLEPSTMQSKPISTGSWWRNKPRGRMAV